MKRTFAAITLVAIATSIPACGTTTTSAPVTVTKTTMAQAPAPVVTTTDAPAPTQITIPEVTGQNAEIGWRPRSGVKVPDVGSARLHL